MKDLLDYVQQVEQDMSNERMHRVPVKHRKVRTLLFVDLAKAFDKVDRLLLLRKLQDLHIPGHLLNAICALLRSTKMTVDQQTVPTLTGVP